jgi:hypothetical protein
VTTLLILCDGMSRVLSATSRPRKGAAVGRQAHSVAPRMTVDRHRRRARAGIAPIHTSDPAHLHSSFTGSRIPVEAVSADAVGVLPKLGSVFRVDAGPSFRRRA